MTSEFIWTTRHRASQILDLPHWTLLAAVTVISFLYSGYSPAYNNNIYHIPILLESYDLPQFSEDPFIQSLRNFSSGFWIVFAGAGRLVGVKPFLTVGLVVTHLAFFAAALHLAWSVGLRERRALNLFLLLLCFSPWAYGHAAGDGGILLNYFTHSELANASLLMGLSCALRQRYGAVAIATCLTFFLNAFMAVWMVPPLALLAGYQLVTGQIALRRLAMPAAIWLAVGSPLLALPLHNILQNPELNGTSLFSYRDFLWDFFPLHFFLWSLPPRTLAIASIQILVLLLSVRVLGAGSRAVLILVIGMLSVIALGVLVALLTDSRIVLNLHLIRSFVMIAMLLAIIVAVVASRWLLCSGSTAHRTLGLGLAAALVGGKVGLLLALLLFLVELWNIPPAAGKLLQAHKTRACMSWLLGVCLMAGMVGSSVKFWGFKRETATSEIWENIGRWAKAATPTNAVFQVPTEGSLGFSLTSERRLWFDGKYGAAVMWSPSYYTIWEQRHKILVDRSIIDRKEARIDFLVMPCDDIVADIPVHAEKGICVYKLT